MYNRFTSDKRHAGTGLAAAAALLLALAGTAVRAQSAGSERGAGIPAIDTVVGALVDDALAANLELDAAAADVQQRLAALDQARARYLPALDLSARYTRANGGRTIEFPVGDLLNPVYATLNQLSGTHAFAPVPNQSIDFQRTREQQTDLILTQPLYDARIAAGRHAAEAGVAASTAARAALAARIRRDMREAYYRWLQARAQVGILTATADLATENLRVNRSLLDNGRITPDLVYRAEADLLEVCQSLLDAGNAVRLAQSYVNLLRNAPFDRALPPAAVADGDVARLHAALGTRLGLTELQRAALVQRPELRQLDAVASAAGAGEALARAAFRPQLALQLDGGTQGRDYGFTASDRFILASVVLKFNLFAGGADQAGLASAHAQLRAAQSQRAAEELQIRLQVEQALSDLEVAEASLSTAAKRVEAAGGAFRIASRKRDLGQVNQAEFIDARRALTDAELNQNITRFAALSHVAELEYALGSPTPNLPPESQP
jgi:outer membrane protein TolC